MAVQGHQGWGSRAAGLTFDRDWLPPEIGTYEVNVESFKVENGTRSYKNAGLTDLPGIQVRSVLRLLEDPWQVNANVQQPRAIGTNHTNFFVPTNLDWDRNNEERVPPGAIAEKWRGAYWQIRLAEEGVIKLLEAIFSATGTIRGESTIDDLNYCETLVEEQAPNIRIRVGRRTDKRNGNEVPTFDIVV